MVLTNGAEGTITMSMALASGGHGRAHLGAGSADQTGTTRRWVPAHPEDGFTLVESLVSIVLILILTIPITTLILRSLESSTANGSRQAAALLATEIVSNVQQSPYGNVGFTAASLASASSTAGYETSVGTTYVWNGQTLAEVTTQPVFTVGPGAGVVFAPIMNVTDDNTKYVLTTHLAYESGQVPACPGQSPAETTVTQAYIHVYVNITWNNGSIQHEKLSQDSLVYPGGLAHYNGPQYNAANVPPTPTNITASSTFFSGEVTVGWSMPSTWNGQGCFAIGYSDSQQFGASTGMLPLSAVGTSSPFSYTISGLASSGNQQVYTFYVIAYSPDGVEYSESEDSPQANAPLGPVVDSVTPQSGTLGSSVTITGSGFTSTMNVAFCPNNVKNCSPVWNSFTGCGTAGFATCAVTSPATLPAGLSTGVFFVIAQNPTTKITAPELLKAEWDAQPKISALGTTSGPAGTVVQVSGTNLFGGTLFQFVQGSSVTTATAVSGCDTTGYASCDVTVPTLPAGGTYDIVAYNGGASSLPTTSADQFDYT
jgi:type II secretory pathway pseudopilin PulG